MPAQNRVQVQMSHRFMKFLRQQVSYGFIGLQGRATCRNQVELPRNTTTQC
jgi:hypothetical protein